MSEEISENGSLSPKGLLKRHKELRREIYKMAWPSIAEQVLVMLVNMTTTIFMGHVSTQAQAAVGVVGLVLGFIQAMFAALSTGATVLVAHMIGQDDIKGAREVTRQSLMLAVVAALGMTAIFWIFSEQVVNLFMGNAEAQVLSIAKEYYGIVLISIPALIINMVINGAFRGSGNMRIPMYIATITNIVHIAISAYLIFGLDMGVKGAAICTVITRMLGLVLTVLVIFLAHSRIQIHIRDKWRLQWSVIKRLCRVGIPASIESVILQGGFLLLQSTVLALGTVQSAAYNSTQNLNQLVFMPVMGLGMVATTMMGQSMGAKNPKRAENATKQNLLISIVWAIVIGILIFIFAPLLAKLYNPNEDVIIVATGTMRILAFGEVFMAIMNILSASLRGAGDVRYVLFTSIGGLWLLRIGLTLLLINVFHFGIEGVYIGMISDFALRSILYGIRFKQGKWKNITV